MSASITSTHPHYSELETRNHSLHSTVYGTSNPKQFDSDDSKESSYISSRSKLTKSKSLTNPLETGYSDHKIVKSFSIDPGGSVEYKKIRESDQVQSSNCKISTPLKVKVPENTENVDESTNFMSPDSGIDTQSPKYINDSSPYIITKPSVNQCCGPLLLSDTIRCVTLGATGAIAAEDFDEVYGVPPSVIEDNCEDFYCLSDQRNKAGNKLSSNEPIPYIDGDSQNKNNDLIESDIIVQHHYETSPIKQLDSELLTSSENVQTTSLKDKSGPSCSYNRIDLSDSKKSNLYSKLSDQTEEISEKVLTETALPQSIDLDPAPAPSSLGAASLMMSLSFCGCGFLGIYHLGVAHVLTTHGQRLLLNTSRYCGASAGALVAAVLAIKGTDQKTLKESLQFTYDLAAMVHKKPLGLLTPRLSLLDNLKDFLEKTVPNNGHEVATGRLYVSLTKFGKRENILVSEFTSKEHLIQCLLASSYVPFATGTKPVNIEGALYMDGGITDNLPCPPDGGRTVYVSPFSGKQEICPTDTKDRELFTRINNQDFQVCQENIVRGLHAFFPPKMKVLEDYYDRGRRDAERFLKNESLWEESPEQSPYSDHYKVLKGEENNE